jgi:hypothetical protein
VIVLVLAGAGAAVLTRPDAWPEPLLAALPAPQPQLQPQDFPLDPGREGVLFSQLDAADRAWTPRAEPIPGGGTRYTATARHPDAETCCHRRVQQGGIVDREFRSHGDLGSSVTVRETNHEQRALSRIGRQ